MLRAFGHSVATCCDMLQHVGCCWLKFVKPRPNDSNISQNRWPSICKPRSNDRNIWTQQISTLLRATCCTRLTIMLQDVAKCCELKIELVRIPTRNIVARTWPNDYNLIMQHPQMLHEEFDHFQIWVNNTQHVATSRNRVAKRTQHVALNNVVICCVEMLRLFDRGLQILDQKCRAMLRWDVAIIWPGLNTSSSIYKYGFIIFKNLMRISLKLGDFSASFKRGGNVSVFTGFPVVTH